LHVTGVQTCALPIYAVPTLKGGSTVGVPSPPAIWMPDGSIVTPDLRDTERLQGFRAGWTQPATRVAREGMRWKLVGNAVSVPAARWLGERLAKPGRVDLADIRPVRSGGAWPDVAWNVGEGRLTCSLSAWPKHLKRRHLHEFLTRPPKPLSAR